jgi:TRAP-type transport system small permease protein
MMADAPRVPVLGGSAFALSRVALARLDLITRQGIITAMAAMTILIVTQVFFRYVLANSIDWAEEGARIAFIWAIFLAIPHGIRSGIHVGIDVVVQLLPASWQEALFRLSALLGIILMAIVFFYAWSASAGSWATRLPTVPITSSVYYLAVLVAAGHSILHLALLAWGGRTTWQEEPQA